MNMWLARGFEERSAGHAVLEAMERTPAGVWAGTFAAAPRPRPRHALVPAVARSAGDAGRPAAAIPIAFGLGVEYAVNVMRRYVQEEAEGNAAAVRAAVAETGGAVILCSITTILGYITLHSSQNQAIQSFGDAGGISEVACISAAVLTIPATLLWLERRARRRGGTSIAAAHTGTGSVRRDG